MPKLRKKSAEMRVMHRKIKGREKRAASVAPTSLDFLMELIVNGPEKAKKSTSVPVSLIPESEQDHFENLSEDSSSLDSQDDQDVKPVIKVENESESDNESENDDDMTIEHFPEDLSAGIDPLEIRDAESMTKCPYCEEKFKLQDKSSYREHAVAEHLMEFYSNILPPEASRAHVNEAIQRVVNMKRKCRKNVKYPVGCPNCSQAFTKGCYLEEHIILMHFDTVVDNLQLDKDMTESDSLEDDDDDNDEDHSDSDNMLEVKSKVKVKGVPETPD